jgi:hypothetical protein
MRVLKLVDKLSLVSPVAQDIISRIIARVPAVLGDVELLVDVFEILLELLLSRKSLRPSPVSPELFEREFVDGDVRVDTSTGVAVPVPDATERGSGVDEANIVAQLAKLVEVVDTTEPPTDDKDIQLLLDHGF